MSGRRTICPLKSSACIKEDCEHSIELLTDTEYSAQMKLSQQNDLPIPEKYACIWKELGKGVLLISKNAQKEVTAKLMQGLSKKRKTGNNKKSLR